MFDRNKSKSFGGERRNSSDRPKKLVSAICDSCGARCKLPFKPIEGKPVYCSDCFEQRGNGRDKGDCDSFGGNNRGRESFGGRDRDRGSFKRESGAGNRDLEQINRKLDKILEILESGDY